MDRVRKRVAKKIVKDRAGVGRQGCHYSRPQVNAAYDRFGAYAISTDHVRGGMCFYKVERDGTDEGGHDRLVQWPFPWVRA